MNPEVKAAWLTALRSGEYKQGRNNLRRKRTPRGGEAEDSYCCLGVLCDLAIKDGVEVEQDYAISIDATGSETLTYRYDGNNGTLPSPIRRWAGLNAGNPEIRVDDRLRSLANLNDNYLDFNYIADLIEEHL